MADPINVFVIPDGPIKVTGAGSVHFCGEPVAASGDLYLCRCGESSNAPFCDGSHSRSGFSGACESSKDKEIRVWEGNTLRTFFNPNTCMHVFYCKPLKALRERELAGDASAAAEIIEVIGTCPSGALSHEVKGAGAQAAPAAAVAGPVIDIVEGGEIRLQAAYSINEPLMARQTDTRATLCRCGLSKNKPWCDGRHRKRKDFR